MLHSVARVVLLAALCSTASAQRRQIELGAGLAFDALGSYDVGEGLGGPAMHSDLGPGTLGVVVHAGAFLTPAVFVAGEGVLGIGGLVRTDERYFGGRSNVGSTLTAQGRVGGGALVLQRGKLTGLVGAHAGFERLSEATGAGTVRLDAVVAGPWIGVDLAERVRIQLAADLHVPVRAAISNQDSGDPTGVFASGGVRVRYVFGVGSRL